MSIGRGFFDVTRLRKYGFRGSLKLGTADGSPDPDCPCLNGDLCPCNHWKLTSYCKISGLKEDVKWAAAEVSVYLDQDRPDGQNAVDTTLVITVDDNCNTGFSDDSGVQKPCLRDTDSVVVRIVPRPVEQTYLYVSALLGLDVTRVQCLSTFLSVSSCPLIAHTRTGCFRARVSRHIFRENGGCSSATPDECIRNRKYLRGLGSHHYSWQRFCYFALTLGWCTCLVCACLQVIRTGVRIYENRRTLTIELMGTRTTTCVCVCLCACVCVFVTHPLTCKPKSPVICASP